MNSSSDLTISSDWDIIDDEMSRLISNRMNSEEANSEDLEEKENMQKGSCVDDIPEQEVNGAQEDSNVADVPDGTGSEINNQHESSSSSEFDVLDETVEDNHSNLSFSHMEYSLSASLESSHPSLVPEVEDAEVEADPKDETPQLAPSHQYSINVHPYLVAVTLSLAFIAILVASAPFMSIQQMKKRMSSLQTENFELKNLVQTKMENDKILMALEEQIKSLKDENFKLSESMKSLILQLEYQTLILQTKQHKEKDQDPYRNEIFKLKEKINLLQLDNLGLRKQLIRTRYGINSPHPKETNTNPAAEEKELKDKTDNKENRDNSSEILMEEIKELRKKLYVEVEKMKDWKDSVQNLVKALENGFSDSISDNEEENFKSKKPSSEHPKESKSGKKGKKFPDWSWGGVKKNFKDALDGLHGIDIHHVVSSYMNKKKIEGVFESVNHYFNKAHEKTKKVLNFNDDINEEMWNFFGLVKDQLHDVRNRIFQKNYPTEQTPPKTEDYKSQYHAHSPKLDLKMPKVADIHDFETDKKFDRYEEQSKPKKASNENFDKYLNLNIEDLETSPTTETPNSEKSEMTPEDKEMNQENSWMFKRAAHRSQLREEEQEAFTNWFLKRGRDFHYNEDMSLKEWFKETYQNKNSDQEE